MTPGEWIEWAGGECPVGHDVEVDVRFRDGTVWNNRLAGATARCDDDENYWIWEPSSPEDDIIAYRVVQS